MEYIYPNYYSKFSCVAGACKDTCCAGWKIMIDGKSIKKYQRVTGGFGNRLNNSILWKEKCFEQSEDGRCAFLNEENLCDIYDELGKGALCDTCRTYPRHIEEFENLREISLSLSCPEACRIILNEKEPLSFDSVKKNEQWEEIEDFDFLFFTKLEEIREYLFRLFQKEEMDIYDRLLIGVGFAHDAQRRILRNEIFLIDDLIHQYDTKRAVSYLCKKRKTYHIPYSKWKQWMYELKGIFQTLEPLKKDWFSFLDEAWNQLVHLEEEEYKREYLKFKKQYQNLAHDIQQIAVTLTYTYLCGAVYDYDLFSKVKFIFISCFMIETLDFARYMMNQCSFSEDDQIDITYRYSREIEHSDWNLEILEKNLKTNSLFHIDKLMSALSMK